MLLRAGMCRAIGNPKIICLWAGTYGMICMFDIRQVQEE